MCGDLWWIGFYKKQFNDETSKNTYEVTILFVDQVKEKYGFEVNDIDVTVETKWYGSYIDVNGVEQHEHFEGFFTMTYRVDFGRFDGIGALQAEYSNGDLMEITEYFKEEILNEVKGLIAA